MSELIRMTAAALATEIASGQVSAVEVAQAHLDRIGAVDEAVHAFLHVSADSALEQARIALVQAEADRFADSAALFQALGGGWWNRTAGPDKPAANPG